MILRENRIILSSKMGTSSTRKIFSSKNLTMTGFSCYFYHVRNNEYNLYPHKGYYYYVFLSIAG